MSYRMEKVLLVLGLLVFVGAVQAFTPDQHRDRALAVRHMANPPDAGTLALWSTSAGVPTPYTYAIAYTESGGNLNPRLRGGLGEWGRFQIKPSTWRETCPDLDVRLYDGNIACFLRITRRNAARCTVGDWRCVAARYNGAGPAAERYASKVLGRIDTIVMAKVGGR